MEQPMDLRFTPAQEAFRHEARAWLAAQAPPPRSLPSLDTAEGFEAHRAWEQTMFDDRWSVVSWPEQFGGRGVGILDLIAPHMSVKGSYSSTTSTFEETVMNGLPMRPPIT